MPPPGARERIVLLRRRIAALEADIRERAFFNRRLKGERFMDRRAAEIEDWRVEQARLKGLAEHLAAEKEAAAERATAEKAAAEKAAAEKAAAEKAAAEKATSEPELPPDLAPNSGSKDSSVRADQLGVNAPPADAPIPLSRPKPHSAPEHAAPADPSASGLY